MVASASAVLMLLVETVSTVLPPLSFSVQLAADLVIVTPEGQSVRFVMKQQVSVSVSLEPQVASVPTVCQVFGASLIVDHANVMSTVSTAILRRESARDVETSPWVTTVNGVWMVTMVTQNWGQVATAAPACAPTVHAVDGSLRTAVTI